MPNPSLVLADPTPRDINSNHVPPLYIGGAVCCLLLVAGVVAAIWLIVRAARRKAHPAQVVPYLPMPASSAAGPVNLADELRKRPAADADSANLFANLLGILSEMGRVDDAAAVAREALEFMRRTGEYFVEEWAYLFWRRGRLEDAAQLTGASDATQARSGVSPQSNELRLMKQVRAALREQLPADVLAQHLAAGAALGRQELYERISSALR